MEKINKIEKILKTNIYHRFYCDNCNEYLGETLEEIDGYYDIKGEYYLSFFFNGEWLELNKNFCKKCEQEFTINLKETLIKLDFKEKE